MLKTYQRLILQSYIGPFILTFFISVFVLLMQFLWKYIDILVGKGLPWYVITELLMWASFSLVPLALPLAVLLSSIMTFGNLGEHYELVAFKASGISLQRVMRPLIVFSAFVSVGAFFFSNNALPYANFKYKMLIKDISNSKPTLNLKPGVFNSDVTGYSIKIGGKSEDGKQLSDIIIYDHSDGMGNTNVILAKSATMAFNPSKTKIIMNLNDGHSYSEAKNNVRRKQQNTDYYKRRRTHPYVREKFGKMIITLSTDDFGFQKTDDGIFKENASMMNIEQIELTKDTMQMELTQGIESAVRNVRRNYRYADLYINPKGPAVEATPITAKNNVLLGVPKDEQARILETALNIARSSQAILEGNTEEIKYLQQNIARYDVEWHRKYTLSFACFVLFFVAAPLGAIIRKGGLGLPLVVSIALFITFHVITITGEKFTKQLVISPWIGMWLAPAILLPVGIYLTYKATTDSALFDIDRYKLLARLFNRKKTT